MVESSRMLAEILSWWWFGIISAFQLKMALQSSNRKTHLTVNKVTGRKAAVFCSCACLIEGKFYSVLPHMALINWKKRNLLLLLLSSGILWTSSFHSVHSHNFNMLFLFYLRVLLICSSLKISISSTADIIFASQPKVLDSGFSFRCPSHRLRLNYLTNSQGTKQEQEEVVCHVCYY